MTNAANSPDKSHRESSSRRDSATSARDARATRALPESSANLPGSARVSRAGEGVSPSRTFLERKPGAGAFYSRRRLPHFEKPWAIYAVAIGTKSRRCLSPNARTVVLDALRFFHIRRYELFAACVMPDHIHFLLQPWPKGNDDAGNATFWQLSELIHSIKSFSAHEINKIENKEGAVWELERFDRYVRSDHDLEEKYQYILRNPWDAGVAGQDDEYPWIWTQETESHKESSSRRDSATSARDARATQSSTRTALNL